MLRVLRADEMKACDARMIEEMGVPSAVLMERAALETATEVLRLAGGAGRRVLILAGSGNNGGDGFACGRILFLKGMQVELYAAGNPAHMTEETRRQASICRRLGIPETDRPEIAGYDVIVDALLGIGLARPVEGALAELIEEVNRSGVPVVSVDIPSGIHADSGQVLGTAVRAASTVTMQCVKPGLLLYPGAEYAGRLVTADLGILDAPPETEAASGGSLQERARLFLFEKEDLQAALPVRQPWGNKGTFGKLLVIAGSPDLAGAACMCGNAALRTGAGMVKVLTHRVNRPILQSACPELMLSTYESTAEAVRALEKDLTWCDGVVCGPGLGTSETAKNLVEVLLTVCTKPLVLDADGLNALEGHAGLLAECPGPLYLTPHMGEMARLTGCSLSGLKASPAEAALALAEETGAVCILKDARTVTALPGGTVYLNRYGNSGMATAGSGDVLAGVLGSLLVQGCAPAAAGAAAVCLHAAAGDRAADMLGERFMTATDLINGLMMVLKTM